jgi:hypothetical protein
MEGQRIDSPRDVWDFHLAGDLTEDIMIKMTMVKFVIPCLLFAAVPSFASQEQSMEQTPQRAPGSQEVFQPPDPQGTPAQTLGSPGQTPGPQGKTYQQLLSEFLAQGKSPEEAMRLATQQSQGQFDVNAAITNAVKNNDGKFDQGCVQTLMSEAKKRGTAAELAMVQQLLKTYPRQLSLIRSVALQNCSQAARSLCNNALLAAENRQSPTQTFTTTTPESSGGANAGGSTAARGVVGQLSTSVNDVRNQGVASTRDTGSADSLSYTPSTARNQSAVLSQGENKMVEEQRLMSP